MLSFREMLAEAGNTVGIQVIDPKEAIKTLKKAGVVAKKVRDDEVSAKLSDKKKIIKWMKSEVGFDWDDAEIKDSYPELFEAALAFPVVVVVNRRPVAIANNPQQMSAVKKKYPSSSKDSVEFMTHQKWKKDYGFSRQDTEIVDRFIRNSK